MPPSHLCLDEFPLKWKDEVSNCPLHLLESHSFAQVLGKWHKTWEHICSLHEKKDLVLWRSIYVYPQLAVLTLFFLSSKKTTTYTGFFCNGNINNGCPLSPYPTPTVQILPDQALFAWPVLNDLDSVHKPSIIT